MIRQAQAANEREPIKIASLAFLMPAQRKKNCRNTDEQMQRVRLGFNRPTPHRWGDNENDRRKNRWRAVRDYAACSPICKRHRQCGSDNREKIDSIGDIAKRKK